jgi:prepilin-type N-terminal cleavage/methylation domain-containing protein
MRTRKPFSAPRPARRQRGFSMIEALIAAALIGAVAVGVIPLWTRAMTDNMAGADYTRVTNYAKSKEEELAHLDQATAANQVQTGTQRQIVEYMDPATGRWIATKPLTALTYWTRTTTITLYGVHDTDANGLLNSPLPAGSDPKAVHVVQTQVQVQSMSAIGAIGTRRSTIIRYYKSF